jgi:hypothetical protein
MLCWVKRLELLSQRQLGLAAHANEKTALDHLRPDGRSTCQAGRFGDRRGNVNAQAVAPLLNRQLSSNC